MHKHVLSLCAFCNALSVSLSGSLSSTHSSTVPSRIWDSATVAALRMRMTASFSTWLLKYESNSYFIMATVSSETQSGSITDIEDDSSSFMGVMLS
jgi:hypothetical protein